LARIRGARLRHFWRSWNLRLQVEKLKGKKLNENEFLSCSHRLSERRNVFTETISRVFNIEIGEAINRYTLLLLRVRLILLISLIR